MSDLPASVRLETGRRGLPVLRVNGPAARAEIYLHGATVTDWTPRGRQPVLWVSSASRFTADAPIRGGVPICFPWFGARAGHPESPSHGFARRSDWVVVDARDDGDEVIVRLRLTDRDAAGASAWPHPFEALYTVVVGSRLTLALTVTNRGSDDLSFEEALHTYLSVRDIRATEVIGLEGAAFCDSLAGPEVLPAENTPVRFGAETDRVYPGSTATTTVLETGAGRSVVIAKAGSATTVVWNPWIVKAAALADLADDEWKRLLCVETGNLRDAAIRLAPGQSHTMTATFELSPPAKSPTQKNPTS